jgi:polysaccharide biosynthesis PFTS motif protein
MRGYWQLKTGGQLDRIADVREALTNTPLMRVSGRASALIFGAALSNAELAVRQYILIRVALTTLNKALLFSLGRPGGAVVHPLPREWRTVLKQRGFRVNRILSALVWQGYVFAIWGYGALSICRRVSDSLVAMSRSPGSDHGRYAYFDRISAANLPQPGADRRSHDVVTWYAQWPGRVSQLDTLCHNVPGAAPREANGLPVVAMSSPIPPLVSPGRLLRYVGWAVAATALAAIDILRGRWWHALLLSEASSAALARAHAPAALASDYLIHNSGWIYRPLWTYEGERAGSRITFYFYSTNCETFKRPDGYPVQANSWQVMNWPLYVVWDDYQAEFVRRAVGHGANIQVVGPIWFGATSREMPAVSPRAVAVFDVQPWRNSGYQFLGLADEYYTPVTVNRFLLDIHAAIQRCGGTMVLKRKRQIGHWLHPRYIALVEQLGRSEHFLALDPDLAALRVIERCQAVVSLPFTSTALLGREMGKPSIYYDPHGVVQKDDRAAHGIPIVTGTDELNAWMAAHLDLPTGVEQPVAR